MANEKIFTYVEPDLFPVLEELRRREPIFHTREFGTTLEDFERATAPHYWEVGASGRRYSREFILRTLEQNPPVDAVSANWQTCDLGLRRLGPDTYLLTYTLHQGEPEPVGGDGHLFGARNKAAHRCRDHQRQ
jgi:hypothetical protein